MQNKIISSVYKCPVCGANMSFDDRSAFCCGEKKHCFDFSSSGYLNLATRYSGGGDSKSAVRARTAFLESDYYLPIAQKLCEIVNNYSENGIVIDAGCGEGYYTNILARSRKGDVLGFDLSKFAIDHAAKAARCNEIQNASYSVANIFELPIKDSCADTIINVFAPCASDEFSRVLRENGILVLCGAGENHLYELKKIIYDDVYINGKRNDLPSESMFCQIDKQMLSFEAEIDGNEMIDSLFSMTPYYWRTSVDDKAKLNGIEHLKTRVEVEFYVYKKIRKGIKNEQDRK